MMTATRRRPRGFTLIEIILSVAMATALLGAMLWFHRHAAEVRADVSAEMDKLNTRRMVMNRMTQQLRAAIAYEFLSIGMEGDAEKILFITASLPGEAAWAQRNITDDPIPPEQDLRMVSYGLRIDEDEDGVEYIAGLESSEQKIIAAQTAEEGQGIASRLLSPAVMFVRFRYHDGTEWKLEWQDGKLPRAVEIALGEQPLPEGVEPEEYPYELTWRVVYLPGSAEQRRGGNIIRGLGGGL